MAVSHPANRPGALRTELFLLAAGIFVLGIGALPARDQNVPAWERGIFRAVNDLPELFYRPVWVIMQFGNGAAIAVVALIALVWRHYRLAVGPRLRWVFFPLAVVVCVARVYVGAHFPLDVVGGAALGLAGGALFGVVLSVRHHGARSRADSNPALVSPDP